MKWFKECADFIITKCVSVDMWKEPVCVWECTVICLDQGQVGW